MADWIYLDGVEINCAMATSVQLEALWRLYDNRHRFNRNNRIPIVCANSHRGRMYLRTNRADKTRLEAVHYGGEGSCKIMIRHESEGVQHLMLKEFAADALDCYPIIREHSTGNGTRLDLFADAPHPFGVEAQFSKISVRDAKARTTKSANAGAFPVWLPWAPNRAPEWTKFVPNFRHNDTEIDWRQKPPQGAAAAYGIRKIIPGHCVPSGPFEHCPESRQTSCGGWHPDYERVAGWRLGEALRGVGAGALVPHQGRKGYARIVLSDTFSLYEELTGKSGLLTSSQIKAALSPPGDGRECTSERAYEANFCGVCAQPLWAPLSSARGYCERCFIDYIPASKPVQLQLWKPEFLIPKMKVAI